MSHACSVGNAIDKQKAEPRFYNLNPAFPSPYRVSSADLC